jgi:hypothetical protein
MTSLIGILAMLLGAWSFYLHWNHQQTVYFNLVYGEVPALGLFLAGWIGLHAADGRHIK